METEISPATTAIVALMNLKGLGRRGALKIVNNTIDDADRSDYYEVLSSWLLQHGTGVSKSEFVEIWAKSLEQLNRNQKAGIQVFSFHDERYPKHLRNIPDPPAVLFVKGKTEGLHSAETLAIIGTRKPTPYGKKVAHKSARTAAEKGFVVVSGLAYGCDTHAHEGCLEAGGIGIAVLAHGLDKVYPTANRDLANRLVERGGCLVSEYPVGLKPARSAFVERDRIQSGLSEAVLVIETGVNGGTMHTVRFARGQKRPLACIDYTEQSSAENKAKGNQKLIEDGDTTPIRDGEALTQFLDKIKSLGSRESTAEKPDNTVDQLQLSLAFPE